MTDTEMRDDLKNIQLDNDSIDEGLYSRQLFVLVSGSILGNDRLTLTGCRRHESYEPV